MKLKATISIKASEVNLAKGKFKLKYKLKEVYVKKICGLAPIEYRAMKLDDAITDYEEYIRTGIIQSHNRAEAIDFPSFQDWLDTEI